MDSDDGLNLNWVQSEWGPFIFYFNDRGNGAAAPVARRGGAAPKTPTRFVVLQEPSHRGYVQRSWVTAFIADLSLNGIDARPRAPGTPHQFSA